MDLLPFNEKLPVSVYLCGLNNHLMSFPARKISVLLSMIIALLSSCGGSGQQNPPIVSQSDSPAERVVIPVFNADSAFSFVEKQTLFGPRVPNTEAHRECGIWLAETLGRFADTLYIQDTRTRAFDGTVLNIRNIIGSFQPEKRNRILLCAHWDSRPFADWDEDPARHYEPIDGANDGASGVGVLLEIARHLSQLPTGPGIDIIFFDAEDYGKHEAAVGADGDTWALGAQHWATNPHRSDYQAHYGILLDMVGAENATFKREGFSMLFAPGVVRKVWDTARRLGYGNYFPDREGTYVTDDHYYVNTIRDIPTINIIHLDDGTPHGFFPQWHTTADRMEHIDPASLKAVGQTVLTVIYEE